MSAVGLPLEDSHGGVDYFCESCIQLSCGPNDQVWFIGVSGHSKFTFKFKGVDVFGLPATEVFSLMAELDDSGPHDFTSYEYCFPNQILTLWDADEQYDRQEREAREVWGQVGIGNEAYFSAITSIKNKV